MQVVRFTNWTELAPYAAVWDRLAGDVPFRGWTWLSHWWRHHGTDDARRRLAVLCAFDDSGVPAGILPLYLDHSALYGRVLRLLGTGKVCSDYLGVLCRKADESAVVESLADYLIERFSTDGPEASPWDLIPLDGIDAGDSGVAALAERMAASRCTVHRRAGLNCWRIDLPANWDAYHASLSRNNRRDMRRIERDLLNTGRAKLRSVEKADELPWAMNLLIELHQRRRGMLGDAGCFADVRFLNFFRDVVPDLYARGQVRFDWLEWDGRPIAVEYQLENKGIIYAYQTGIDPDSMELKPGKLLTILILHRAIEQGCRAFDFLRGDEPYKAQPRPSVELRIVPRRGVARLRHHAWLAGSNVKRWIKRNREAWAAGSFMRPDASKKPAEEGAKDSG